MSLAKRSGSMRKVEELERWRESDAFTQPERAALEYAEAMTVTDRRVTDDLMARLKTHFQDDAIVELTGLIGFQNLSSKFNAALDLPAQGFCSIPLEARAAKPRAAP